MIPICTENNALGLTIIYIHSRVFHEESGILYYYFIKYKLKEWLVKVGMSRRVVVTGVGAVTPLGNDAATTWNNILNGVSGIEEATLVDKDLVDVHITAEVKGFQPENHMSIKDAKRMGRFTQFAVAASKMALNDAGIIINENVASERVGVWIGSGIGGLGEFESQHRKFLKKGGRTVSPFTIPMFIPDMASGYVSIETGAKGINNCSVTACASGSNSIGDAFRAIKNGRQM